jgi:peptidyl-prolyl cis-trans isomerase C
MTLQSLLQRLRELLRRAWREPLVVFMALGLGLYALYGLVSDYSDDPASRRIVVDRQALLTYMQARASDYGTRPEARLDAMSPAEVAALAQTYAREEAMYREALALGLDKGDYLVRQRLVQSLRFLFRNLGETGEPSPAQLQSFYDANRSRYAAPASITFTHIFFAQDRHGAKQAEALAAATQAALNSGRLSLSGDAPWPGDRFAYHLNYADRDEASVASHFGKDMAQRLFAAKADPKAWQGPFRSDSGFHLVRIERLMPGRVVPLEQVREEVVRDYREMQGLRLERSAIDGLVRDFDVAVSPELQGMMKAGPQ